MGKGRSLGPLSQHLGLGTAWGRSLSPQKGRRKTITNCLVSHRKVETLLYLGLENQGFGSPEPESSVASPDPKLPRYFPPVVTQLQRARRGDSQPQVAARRSATVSHRPGVAQPRPFPLLVQCHEQPRGSRYPWHIQARHKERFALWHTASSHLQGRDTLPAQPHGSSQRSPRQPPPCTSHCTTWERSHKCSWLLKRYPARIPIAY